MGLKKLFLRMLRNSRTKELNYVTVGVLSSIVGLFIIYLDYMFFIQSEQLFAIISMIGVLTILTPPVYLRYRTFSKIKKIEEIFPIFLADITSNINSGMTLPQAIRSLREDRYGVLSPYVKEISAKISWGVPFDKVFTDFAKSIDSISLKRTVKSIIEAHKSGGTMNTVLRAVSESLYDLEKIKKERSASVYSQMLNGYMIYFIFLGVMIGMSKFLLPTFDFGDDPGGFADALPLMFRNIVLIQGIFAGLTIGKMSEGRMIAGVKHAMALGVVGFTATVLV